ncbi:NAD(P)/FAD-dependent oxidoreductase [Noviherbaspirillum sedimenti]|uniref:Ferredoxin reductase n=1 Tax=Noviherbaspirillum sedimenti TaxID=2320865 RepID=A0A3A3G6B7_9BURK|nr:FAD-dependent oxidoreductase [Noviherbaspirillum sedimenti]RJG03364.1 ferredoxin reductase [Noviherbaspirillum sedimenti]
MSIESKIVIIGAGHAGGALAAQLREQGHRGPLCVIGDEPYLPYQRPPLSKAVLKGATDTESLILRNAAFYQENDIEVRTGQTVSAIDRNARHVTLAGGESLPYDFLILATGARPRQLAIPGAGLANILTLRGIDDAARLKSALQPGRRLAIVGGGYVGLEVAASARALGMEVTVVEREARLLARVASEPLATFYERIHQQQGVQIIRNANLSHFEGDDHVTAVHLEDDRRLACDVAVVGVGALPRDELARAAGLHCENGVMVDQDARTSDPAIFAIGDLSWRPLPVYGDRMFRLESVPNALEQARQVACAIVGKPRPAAEVPWFWSDQYDIKLQIAGLPFDADRQVVRGAPEQSKFAVYHLRGEQVMAVEAINSPLDFIAGKQFILSQALVCADRLANMAIKAKDAALAIP